MTEVDAPLSVVDSNLSVTHHRPSSLGHASNGRIAPSRNNSDAVSTMSVLPDTEARCGGCQNIIDQENGGIVVSFGSAFWHVDCFRCAKCKNKVSADTNLLLLSDGSPVCGNCSYQCFVCKQAITEEAIMTGNESYHAQCFTCRTCKRRIEELVFAKTTQGIYCMACHNERVARSRRHAEAKRQRAARKERERDEALKKRDPSGSGSLSPLAQSGMTGSSTSTSLNILATAAASGSGSEAPSATTSPTVTPAPSSVHTERDKRTSPLHSLQEATERHSGDISRERSPPPTRAATLDERSVPGSPGLVSSPPKEHPNGRSATTSPVPLHPSSPTIGTPPDSGATPMTHSRSGGGSASTAVGLGIGGGPSLGVPTSRAEKRRSINPSMSFNVDTQNTTFSELRAPSPLRSSFVDQKPAATRSRSLTPAFGPSSPKTERVASPRNLTPHVSTPANGQIASALPVPDDEQGGKLTKPSGDTATSRDARRKSSTTDKPPDGDGAVPRIDAPGLPKMSFSLSDPDFALLLNEANGGNKVAEDQAKQQQQVLTEEPVVSSPTVEEDRDNEPLSMSRKSKRMSLTRSPNMSLLSNAANGGESSPRTVLLSPSDAPIGGTLRRRPSVESFMSVRIEPDNAFSQLSEFASSTQPNEDNQILVDFSLLSAAIAEHQSLKGSLSELKAKYTGAKRSSQQYSEGLTVAGEEYDKEVALRHDLEAEVSRLRAEVHGQSARLSVISSDERRAETMRRISHDMANNLNGLERDISRLRAQRDITMAEVEELQAKKHHGVDGTVEETSTKLGRSLTRRLDTIKEQYREEIGPLSEQREALQREVNDLRDLREQFLEESTSLAAKNEELADFNAQLSRQTEAFNESLTRQRTPNTFLPPSLNMKAPANRVHPSGSPSLSSLTTSATLHDVPEETARVIKVSKPEAIEAAPARRFKWYKSKPSEDKTPDGKDKGKDSKRNVRPSTEMGLRDHQFQQHSTMRLGRCDLCGEKMWGLQEVKCASCGTVCHSKCAEKLPKSCSGPKKGVVVEDDGGPSIPSMFGREIAEQAQTDNVPVPIIVTKCIEAVEANGMEYEGIYRKTGGTSQSKQIIALFNAGRYDEFDLTDSDNFNDISAITSVLKTYFRELPDPLLTHALHESFVAAANIRDPNNKAQALCALLKELPITHYETLRVLMLHLNRVTASSSINLMTSQNLGVVFGPTLLRSADPGREFGDMAGKALSVQWMVENAPKVFVDRD